MFTRYLAICKLVRVVKQRNFHIPVLVDYCTRTASITASHYGYSYIVDMSNKRPSNIKLYGLGLWVANLN